jgi:hypothetical protein
MKKLITTYVRNCARCGKDHPGLTFNIFAENPPRPFTHWAICPEKIEPILMIAVETNSERVAGVVGECVNGLLIMALDEIKRLSPFEEKMKEMEEFHPRAMKLIKKKKNFIVIAKDEPYYFRVYSMIRNAENSKGTWSQEDEIHYILAMFNQGAVKA